MKHRKKRNFKPIFIIAIIVIPMILLNINKIYEKTYGMLDNIIVRPVKQASTDLVQAAGDSRYNERNFTSTIYKDFTKELTNISTSRKSISYEDVNKDATLYMAETGILPWRVYGKLGSTNYLANRQDAEIKRQYEAGKKLDANLTDERNAQLRGVIGRTIASYTYGKNTNSDLNVGINYILAHTKEIREETGVGLDVDKTQQALWLMKWLIGNSSNTSQYESRKAIADQYLKRIKDSQSSSEQGAAATEFIERVIGTEYRGINREPDIISVSLFNEAKILKEFMEERAELQRANNGQDIVDNMVSQYGTDQENGMAGLVSYNALESEYMVGPFSFNYIRKVISREQNDHSDAANEEGDIVISKISGANIYGIVKDSNGNYKEQLLTDWEFIYTDVKSVYDKDTDKYKVVRNAVADADDNTVNIYPYPNEKFYLKLEPEIKDADNEYRTVEIQAITRIEFTMDMLNATSEVYELSGTYTDVISTTSGESYSSPKKSTTLYQVVKANILTEHKDVSLSVGANQSNGYIKFLKDRGINVSFLNSNAHTEYCIPLTMDMSGKVWKDGDEHGEQNGELDATYTEGEEGVSGVTVYLYNNATNTREQTTTTDADGNYQFRFVRMGAQYYITFEYDWMKYKSAIPLGGDGSYLDYTNNMAAYENNSHASEDKDLTNRPTRTEFNNSFYEITNEMAIGNDGAQQKMNYTYDEIYNSDPVTPQGTIARVQEFRKETSTKTINIVYPLQSVYIFTNKSNSDLSMIDKNELDRDDRYYFIGVENKDNMQIYYASAKNGDENTVSVYNKDTDSEYTKFVKIGDCVNNINLGLIERVSADFAIKNDIEQTMYSLNEVVSNSNIGEFGIKDGQGFDISSRTGNYYNTTAYQELSYDEYSWRSSYMDNKKLLENDELQLYIQYKITIRNQSSLLSGEITELADYFDNELYYSNNLWQYYDKNRNYWDNPSENGYGDIVIPQLGRYTSWAIKNNGRDTKQELGQVIWEGSSRYAGQGNGSAMQKMYTKSLEGTYLAPGEEIDVFIIFKVERQYLTGISGQYIITDNTDAGKQNIAEIDGYRVKNWDGKAGGRVDQDSNPGNTAIGDNATFEDDIDSAPCLKVLVKSAMNEYNQKAVGKGIAGYVWEDERVIAQTNNQVIGNGTRDTNSDYNKFVSNVRVNLVRKEYDKGLEEYIEVAFADDYATQTRDNLAYFNRMFGFGLPESQIVGNVITQATQAPTTETHAQDYSDYYRFGNLVASGKYEVRFVYGTEPQLNTRSQNYDSIKYNGQDYKSTSYTPMDQLSEINPSTEVAFIVDRSPSITRDTQESVLSTVNNIKVSLNSINRRIGFYDTIEFREHDLNNAVNTANNQLEKSVALNKVLFIFTDGYTDGSEFTSSYNWLENVVNAGVKVIAIGLEGASATTFRNVSGITYYNYINDYYTANKMKNIVYNYIMENVMLQANRSHASDYIENTSIPLLNSNTAAATNFVTGRLQVMEYSQRMSAQNANVLNSAYINHVDPVDKNLTVEQSEQAAIDWRNAVNALASQTQMTARSYAVNINFEDTSTATRRINLGLEEIPKAAIELHNEVEDIVITLANNNKIISLKDQMTQNVQLIPHSIYSIYLDEEIMQGAKIEVVYKVTVSNIGEVDSLGQYLKYETTEKQIEFCKALYANLGENAESINARNINEVLASAIPSRITKVYNYCDNLQFRAEENNNWQIINNELFFDDKGNIDYDRMNIENDSNDKDKMRETKVVWSTTGTLDVVDRVRERAESYNSVETASLRNIRLYPLESREVTGGAQVASISTFVKYSKTLAAKDLEDEKALNYHNYSEIASMESLTGRRDYQAAVGDYKPGAVDEGDYDSTGERDTSEAEQIILLPPFGAQDVMRIVLIIAGGLTILAVGIIIIRRKFVIYL